MPVSTPEDLEEPTAMVADPSWDYLHSLQQLLQSGSSTQRGQAALLAPDIAAFKTALAEGDSRLKQRFLDDEPVECLVRDRARLVDTLLQAAWKLQVGVHTREVALLAVGGYGRGELNLCSDIDIMILLPKSESPPWQGAVERFLTFMWDIGLEVGHSVRTIDDCQRESLAEVSVATTLIEARLLGGPEGLFEAMRRALANRACGIIVITTPPTTSSPTSNPAPAGCATSRPSAGWPSGTSVPIRSTSWSSTSS
jgi:[protein-PII] uridylyltransferase